MLLLIRWMCNRLNIPSVYSLRSVCQTLKIAVWLRCIILPLMNCTLMIHGMMIKTRLVIALQFITTRCIRGSWITQIWYIWHFSHQINIKGFYKVSTKMVVLINRWLILKTLYFTHILPLFAVSRPHLHRHIFPCIYLNTKTYQICWFSTT